MIYDFNSSSSRIDTNCEKYSLIKQKFNKTDIIPLWIADMDIDTPSFINKAITNRLKHPIYGYEIISNETYLSQINWLKNRYNTTYTINEAYYSPSVVTSINIFIEAFSNIGDEVIVNTPIYSPFISSIQNQKRVVINNELEKNLDGKYSFNKDSLLKLITPKTKLLLLCNPQNPIGKCWSRDELQDIIDICKKYNILIFSDEIHCDLVYAPNKHIAISTLENAKDITISAYGIAKSFNLSGFCMSMTYIKNNILRKKYEKIYFKYHLQTPNVISTIVFKEVYTKGHIWLEELKIHLYDNYFLLKKLLDRYNNIIKLTPIEATYLAWLDCSGMNLSHNQIEDFFISDVKIGLNSGILFGDNGALYMRLNFAIGKKQMYKVIKRLELALDRF